MDHYSLPAWENSDEGYNFESTDSYSSSRNLSDHLGFQSNKSRPYPSVSSFQRDKVSFSDNPSSSRQEDYFHSSSASSHQVKPQPSMGSINRKDENRNFSNIQYEKRSNKSFDSEYNDKDRSSNANTRSSREPTSSHVSSSDIPRHHHKQHSHSNHHNHSKESLPQNQLEASLNTKTSQVDPLEVKSWLLAQIEKLTIGVETFNSVKKHIADEVEMDKKVIN